MRGQGYSVASAAQYVGRGRNSDEMSEDVQVKDYVTSFSERLEPMPAS